MKIIGIPFIRARVCVCLCVCVCVCVFLKCLTCRDTFTKSTK